MTAKITVPGGGLLPTLPPSGPVPILARDIEIGDRLDGRTVAGIMVYDARKRPTISPDSIWHTKAEVTFTDGSRQTWEWDAELLDVERAT